jgi:glycosyltransferase involved in cell wall biosynthesis
MSADILVSVVIPTIRRPVEILRSVGSVLNQTFSALELIVVIDGPDKATREALATIRDPRLQVIDLPTNVGIAHVRNAGIKHSTGRWVALLDDDDEWLPRKLELQVEAAQRLGGDRILMASHFIDRGSEFERVMPYRDPTPGEPLSEFMFCRKGLASKSGHVQTSTFFVSRLLAQEVQFRPEVRPQEDFDWLLRCFAKSDRPFHVVTETLSIYHNEKITDREGARGEFEFFWNYAFNNRDLFTPAAFSFYLATWCAPKVKLAMDPWGRWKQVYRGMRSGKMTLRCLTFAVIYAALPAETRVRIRHRIATLLPVRSARA